MRAILCAILLLAAASAWADWVKLTETTDTGDHYLDPALISDNGEFRRVVVIQSYATQEPAGTRSRRVSY